MFNSGHFGPGGKTTKFEKTFLADYEYVLQKILVVWISNILLFRDCTLLQNAIFIFQNPPPL